MVKQDLEEFNKAVEKAVEKVVSISKSGKPDDIADIIISSYHKFGDNFLNLVKKKKALLSYHLIDRMELIFKIIFERLNQIVVRHPMTSIIIRSIFYMNINCLIYLKF